MSLRANTIYRACLVFNRPVNRYTLRMDTMKAYVLHGPKDMRLEERPVAPVGDEDVLIRVRRTGICGSDVHYFVHGQIGDFVPKEPFALGHEFAGEVVETGRQVESISVGTRVAIDPQMPCGRCRYCRRGRYNLCTDMKFPGSASCYPHIDGGFGQYVAVPAANCYPLPHSLGYDYAALLEPLTVATHAVLRTNLAGGIAGRSVCITGAGTIGQLVLIVARAFGASFIAVSDIEAFPRELALSSGADLALDPNEQDSNEKIRRSVGEGFDVVIEVSGAPQALAQAFRIVHRGGTIVQVGTQPDSVTLPANLTMSKELALLGSFRSAHVMQTALDLAASGRIDLDPVISAVYPFSKFGEAMDSAVRKEKVVKVQVEQESESA